MERDAIAGFKLDLGFLVDGRLLAFFRVTTPKLMALRVRREAPKADRWRSG
jgi:hypothetical protein